jgi:hypothetical protein
MFRNPLEPSSGSNVQYLAEITIMVQLRLLIMVAVSTTAAYTGPWCVCVCVPFTVHHGRLSNYSPHNKRTKKACHILYPCQLYTFSFSQMPSFHSILLAKHNARKVKMHYKYQSEPWGSHFTFKTVRETLSKTLAIVNCYEVPQT